MALPVTREQIMEAILASLRSFCGTAFRTYSRRFMTWEDVVQSYTNGAPLNQPALFLYDGVGFGGGTENFDPGASFGTPTIVTLMRTIVIYATLPGGGTPQGPDGTTPGGSVLHPLVELVMEALAQNDPTMGTNTLEGLVSHCWVKGDVMLVTGEIDAAQGQGMATLPVEIKMYPSL